MSAEVETMAYAHATPWHGLGKPVSSKMTPEQMLKEAQIDWTVSKAKLALAEGAHKGKELKDKYALVRDSDGRVLSMVGSMYRPLQNADAMSFFKKFVDAGHMTMETAGSLRNGTYIWGLAKIGADFKLANGDRVEGYLLMASPHVLGKAAIYQFTAIRVVCMNTFTAALGSKLSGKSGAFRIPHSMTFDDDMKKKAEEALGISKQQLTEFEQVATLLSKKKVKSAEVDKYFYKVLRLKEKDLKAIESGEKQVPLLYTRLKHAFETSPGSDMATAKGTVWGLFNAVTYAADHVLGSTPDHRLTNSWLGATAQMKRYALECAIELANAK
jgi:phage/plasmid-like protein (TIGR03299 family)